MKITIIYSNYARIIFNYVRGFQIMDDVEKTPELIIYNNRVYGRRFYLKKWNFYNHINDNEDIPKITIESIKMAEVLYQYEKYTEEGEVNYILDDYIIDSIEDSCEILEPNIIPSIYRLEVKPEKVFYIAPSIIDRIKITKQKYKCNNGIIINMGKDGQFNVDEDEIKILIPQLIINMKEVGIPCDFVYILYETIGC